MEDGDNQSILKSPDKASFISPIKPELVIEPEALILENPKEPPSPTYFGLNGEEVPLRTKNLKAKKKPSDGDKDSPALSQ